MKLISRHKQFASALSSTTVAVGTVITLGAAAAANTITLAQGISALASDPLAIKVGDTGIPFGIDDGTAWMDVYCTITSSTQITVTQIDNGLNGPGAAVTFSGAMPAVFNTAFGSFLRRVPVDSFPAAFSTSVPLSQIGTVHMPRYTVAGNLTFTPMANAIRGAMAEYLLILDGTSTLTFSGFTEHGSSSGLLNTAGMPNTVFFWYDGYVYWWSASQAAVPSAIDITAPTMSSAAVANATPSTITLTASETLDSSFVPAASAFAVSGHTVLAVTSVSGTAVTLSVSPVVANAEVLTAGYVQPATNGLRDPVGNLMASFSNLSITNNVQPADNTPPAFGSAEVANAAPMQIVIAMSETLAASTPAAGAFSVSGGKTVSAVAVSGVNVTLTVNSAYVYGDVITVSYTQPGANPRLQDASGNATASFGPYAVTNNVGAAATVPGAPTIGTAVAGDGYVDVVFSAPASNGGAAITSYTATLSTGETNTGPTSPIRVTAANGAARTAHVAATNSVGTGANSAESNSVTPAAAAQTSYPRLSSLSATTVESGTGPYSYAGNGGTLTAETGGITAKSLPASTDGWLEFVITAPNEVVVGFRHTNSATITSNLKFALYASGVNGSLPGSYRKTGVSTSNGVNGAGLTPAAGDRLRVARVGNLLKIQLARAATPTTFVDMDSVDYGSAPQFWVQAIATNTAALQLTAWSGFV